MRLVYYVPYLSFAHLILIRARWVEHHCLLIDGETYVKVTSS